MARERASEQAPSVERVASRAISPRAPRALDDALGIVVSRYAKAGKPLPPLNEELMRERDAVARALERERAAATRLEERDDPS